ncbi:MULTISPECIES: adenylyltransferase/cytidyltransferase family protein [unclassified Paenibacillus]|uniref:adenylyltransferase/cytidyltransferase family protein n=1 Tax=unclassified Paenibacillus TaxID=185978 RepID=UPI0024053EE9|nr:MULTISPECIES: adenylyltransferase/cytidyltransferase family protein [unclassified Paenibacillus]MDF9843774.1 cytidyltransferase-like protein [Paenibacillus sp. PastF-2]MDF9850387.1 cytidyltransferase-like protein [Paenibacillus sp. PastM-2]MDF9856910.1 cytidyltransferase-like protein [Paenibacillus sp. PastF-1]MDH6482233.1 cytidyltransferase-like protein [Paenibacillus sp. PastH-2]MDH6509603.1 cytidyltransferase-like protein [Paenibacillus sp. PastM-3]
MLATDTNKHWNIGYISGAFDMFHMGHLHLIRRSKERCNKLIVGVLTDELISKRKNKWPTIPLKERLEIVGALKYVDEVDVTTEPLIYKFTALEKYGFDAMFSGDDHLADGWGHDEEELKAVGVDLVFFPYTQEVSTSRLQEITLPPRAEHADKARRMDAGIQYLFPFDKVDKNERIIIYGIGKVGEQYFRQLSALDFCEVAAFADTYAQPGDIFEGKRCLTPEEVRFFAKDYDRIVIASTVYHSQILSRLRSLGIEPGRII